MADGVQIDTGQVSDFAKDLRKEADGGFSAAASRGASLHGHGVEFGAGIGAGPIQQAKQKYAYALAFTEANLREYVRAAAVLADAAEQIARDFANADMNSAQTQAQIQSLLNGAILKAQSPQNTDGAQL